MKIMKTLLMLNIPFYLIACHTIETEGPHAYQRHPQKVKYVETENIQWDSTTEEEQELADEI